MRLASKLVICLFTVAMCFPALADQTPAAPQAPPQPAATAQVPTPAPAPAKEVEKKTVPPPGPPTAAPGGPIQLKVGDATLRFGVLLQPQADFQQSSAGGYGQNLLVRRVRFLVGGQVTKTVFFFFETENSRLGNAAANGQKTLTSGFSTLDAVAEWRLMKAFNLAGGLIRVPTSRDALESSSTEFTIDFNTYAFTATTILAGNGGRDTGVQARGYFLGDRLEYRAALVSGLRQAGSRNAFRKVGRLQYDFFDKEVYNLPSYAGSNFGTKKIVAVGAAIDDELGYRGYTADVFGDIPTAFGSALGTLTYQNLDGGDKLITQFGKSKIYTADGGLFFKGPKLGPWARYEKRGFTNVSNKDEKRYLVGLNYYPFGNNFNIKAAYGRFAPPTGRKTNQIVVQLQAYYY